MDPSSSITTTLVQQDARKRTAKRANVEVPGAREIWHDIRKGAMRLGKAPFGFGVAEVKIAIQTKLNLSKAKVNVETKAAKAACEKLKARSGTPSNKNVDEKRFSNLLHKKLEEPPPASRHLSPAKRNGRVQPHSLLHCRNRAHTAPAAGAEERLSRHLTTVRVAAAACAAAAEGPRPRAPTPCQASSLRHDCSSDVEDGQAAADAGCSGDRWQGSSPKGSEDDHFKLPDYLQELLLDELGGNSWEGDACGSPDAYLKGNEAAAAAAAVAAQAAWGLPGSTDAAAVGDQSAASRPGTVMSGSSEQMLPAAHPVQRRPPPPTVPAADVMPQRRPADFWWDMPVKIVSTAQVKWEHCRDSGKVQPKAMRSEVTPQICQEHPINAPAKSSAHIIEQAGAMELPVQRRGPKRTQAGGRLPQSDGGHCTPVSPACSSPPSRRISPCFVQLRGSPSPDSFFGFGIYAALPHAIPIPSRRESVQSWASGDANSWLGTREESFLTGIPDGMESPPSSPGSVREAARMRPRVLDTVGRLPADVTPPSLPASIPLMGALRTPPGHRHLRTPEYQRHQETPPPTNIMAPLIQHVSLSPSFSITRERDSPLPWTPEQQELRVSWEAPSSGSGATASLALALQSAPAMSRERAVLRALQRRSPTPTAAQPRILETPTPEPSTQEERKLPLNIRVEQPEHHSRKSSVQSESIIPVHPQRKFADAAEIAEAIQREMASENDQSRKEPRVIIRRASSLRPNSPSPSSPSVYANSRAASPFSGRSPSAVLKRQSSGDSFGDSEEEDIARARTEPLHTGQALRRVSTENEEIWMKLLRNSSKGKTCGSGYKGRHSSLEVATKEEPVDPQLSQNIMNGASSGSFDFGAASTDADAKRIRPSSLKRMSAPHSFVSTDGEESRPALPKRGSIA